MWLWRSSYTKSGLILLGNFIFLANIISNVYEKFNFKIIRKVSGFDADINIFFKHHTRKLYRKKRIIQTQYADFRPGPSFKPVYLGNKKKGAPRSFFRLLRSVLCLMYSVGEPINLTSTTARTCFIVAHKISAKSNDLTFGFDVLSGFIPSSTLMRLFSQKETVDR